MIRINSPFGKSVAVLSAFSLVFCMVPSLAWAKTVSDAKQWVKSKLPPVKPDPKSSKVLSAESMKSLQGTAGENPYAAGQSKWDVVYQGVNLMTGNYTTNGTDLTFEGGYGIPVNVTRSYSSNSADESPLGKGWTMSVDVRSTAGGLAKSGKSAVRSVPTNFKERPLGQLNDPNAVMGEGSNVQPIQAVLATDSGGQEETIQRDADGILSTPPWDKNKIASEYETVIGSDGTNYQVMTHNVVNTPEGTVYVYDKQGWYQNSDGTVFASRPYDNSSANGEPSNVLKISTATDRHGNVTTYTYNQSAWVYFTKANGTTKEHPLTKVHMPNGHEINFVWGTGANANRIVKVNDHIDGGSSDYREVNYGYTDGLLTSVTTPGGKTTTYGYGSAWNPQEYTTVATNLMTSITSPQGLTENIYYRMQNMYLGPYAAYIGPTPVVWILKHPNGAFCAFGIGGGGGSYRNFAPSDWIGYDQWYHTGSAYNTESDEGVDFGGAQVGAISGTSYVYTREYTGRNYLYNTTVINGNSYANGDTMKYYDPDDQNLLKQEVFTYKPTTNSNPEPDGWDLARSRKMVTDTAINDYQLIAKTSQTSKYNFLGNPLEQTTNEYGFASSTSSRAVTIAKAYWGADKYYQQKATKDQAGRYSYTDYYSSSAAQGKKGQTYKVYDSARTTFTNDSSDIPESEPPCPTANYWKYRLVPEYDTYSAKFDYDSKGRAIDVWKIQSITTSPWTYVRTHTSYGSDTDSSWGQANQVVEDYGGINRTTNTLQYDNYGRAVKVEDAAGKVFHTTYDSDGVISSIEKITGSTSTPIVTYTYGTSGLTNGQVLSVTDNLSGVSASLSYASSGGGIGQVSNITETNGSDSYTTSYTYTAVGDRDTATYTTQSALGLSNTVKWKYTDYVPVGTGSASKRVFQTVANIDPSTGDRTSEEFHYTYTHDGRPLEATFAMTPESGYTPSGGATYYPTNHLPATRARTHYDYDSGGRIAGIYHWWDTKQSNGTYTSAPIRANECTYELSSLNRGLKTQNKYYNVASGSWNLQRTESYGYDADLDYLTSANYGDGLSNATPSWTYDAAGNRASDSTNSGTWSYDNLNRMTASPGFPAYANDILGNRTQRGYTGSAGTVAYGWDDLNRMTSLNIGSTNSNSYAYRADGLRVSKTATGSASSQSSTLYRYDGQMGIEDVEKNSSGAITAVSRYALGIRGIDAISRTTSSGTIVAYPLYDALGNNMGMVSKSGSSWLLSDERTYDAWGQVRSGGTTGDQKGRYCANLGHKQDDESGFVYMRARYYEPSSGRFISQDASHDGANWFSYASSNPISFVDKNGCENFLSIMSGLQASVAIMCMRVNVTLAGLWAIIANRTLMIGTDYIQKINMQAGRLDYQRLYQGLCTIATSNDANKVQMEINTMTTTEGGRAFMQRLFEVASQNAATAQLFQKNDNITIIYWVIEADGGG